MNGKRLILNFFAACSCSNIWFVISNNPEQSSFPPKGIWFHLYLLHLESGDHCRAQARGLKVGQMLLLGAGLLPLVCMKMWTGFTRAEPRLIQTPAKQAVCTKCASHQLTDVSCCSCCSGNNGCEGATAAASSLGAGPSSCSKRAEFVASPSAAMKIAVMSD